MLKMTDVNIGLMRDIDMYTMISKSIRGGLCTTGSTRYAKATNPYMKELYDPDDATSCTLANRCQQLVRKGND